MPRRWDDAVEGHRATVRDAVLDAAAALVDAHGLASVTMSRLAETSGIGRPTLYKYFRDVAAVMSAWHERQVARHLAHLGAVGDPALGAAERLEAVLDAYARIAHEHRSHALRGTEVMAALHRGEHVARAQQQLADFLRDLIADAARAGALRNDVAPDELARYCLHALAAASSLPSEAAVRRLVAVTIAGMRPAERPGVAGPPR